MAAAATVTRQRQIEEGHSAGRELHFYTSTIPVKQRRTLEADEENVSVSPYGNKSISDGNRFGEHPDPFPSRPANIRHDP